jgi:hypothetical protein
MCSRLWYPDDACLRIPGTDAGGIDILTRIDDLSFGEFLDRAERAKVVDIVLPILAAGDIDRLGARAIEQKAHCGCGLQRPNAAPVDPRPATPEPAHPGLKSRSRKAP